MVYCLHQENPERYRSLKNHFELSAKNPISYNVWCCFNFLLITDNMNVLENVYKSNGNLKK